MKILDFCGLGQQRGNHVHNRASSLRADRIADCNELLRATCHYIQFRELGIAIQRSIARKIIERSGMLPENVSAQLTTYLRRG
jgi:hypothetical protein